MHRVVDGSLDLPAILRVGVLVSKFSVALAAGSLALWVGTIGGVIFGFNVGDEVRQLSQPAPTVTVTVTPSAEPTEETSNPGQPEPSPSINVQPPAEKGTTGASGPKGEQGKPGQIGPAGEQGPIGPVGPVGPVGPQGEQGIQGLAGPMGPPGETGATGAAGAQGATGATGPQGPAGPAGATGPMGPVGPQGPSGVALANSPATYDPATQTIGIDQAAFEYLASLGYLQFSTSATATAEVGRLRWNAIDGTLDLSLGGGLVTLQVGQEMVQPVLNNTSETLRNGYAVRITGAESGRMTVEHADASIPAKTVGVIGVLTQDIAPGEVGFVTTAGLVRQLDTSFATPGSTVYVDGGGVLTSIRPVAGAIMVIGHVVISSATQGAIFVDTLTTTAPGAGLPCNAGPNYSPGIYKWETAGSGDYFLSCDITP